ncbi:MAG: hypothetical protein PHO85_03140 [Candidatus Cloacimonetes bacterium]|jgi:hypothetical protein|nr:hypothetical protein [Candidatus Cloacimonadota bacterium]MDD2505746.1 hypothetical protein [Candidatus Cloacimonadota bacterium]MDD4147496.1 hypothetical protein [Candidatus Cloacimonadota bacterium]MDD4559168.1 hypothetical protein [Candidatus Cloacimonadota bacterium]
MNARFYLILVLLSLLFGAWAYLAHNQGESVKACYNELSLLPVYAYVADTTHVEPIRNGLEGISPLKGYEYETGYQAALELIEAYALPLTNDMVSTYSFPDVFTITFPSNKAGIEAKARVMDLLRMYLPEEDIDAQTSAYGKIMEELDRLSHRNLILNIFVGLLLFLIFIFSRLSYELHIYLKQKRQLISVVDVMRHNKLNAAHSWLMMLVPGGVVSGLYYLGVYLERWENLASWWSFASMGILSLIATLVIYFNLRVYEHEAILGNAEPVVVVSEKPENKEADNA